MGNRAEEYEKIVFWSDEGLCFIGMCPELFKNFFKQSMNGLKYTKKTGHLCQSQDTTYCRLHKSLY